ncbi:MAG: Ca-activated chloride channel family protein [Enterobacterales bacterium]|jgi:Ca-activated chloride channel family protein
MVVYYQKHKKLILGSLILMIALFAYLKPQTFADLWLTHDQQGQLLFKLEHYQQAANHFESTRWQAYSLYGAEEYDQAATLYDQFDSSQAQLYRANALAHARRYIKARNIYQQIIDKDPTNPAALNNLKIVQLIIDDVNRMSESQQAEEGDSVKELGDEAQTGDGVEKKQLRNQVLEQLDAEQILLDPTLNEMWLRQVQKDPALFLANKFMIQNEKIKQLKEQAKE